MEVNGAQTSVTKLATNEGVWYSLNIEGQKKPAPRYEQGAVIAGTALYVFGGNHGGRYLNDLWSFDLAKLQWSSISTKTVTDDPELPPPTLTPCAGHSVVVWNRQLLSVGGHCKAKDATQTITTVWSLDLSSSSWSLLTASGTPPSARGGHSATLIGNKLYVFGGEDSSRRVVSDLAVLDLNTMIWSKPQAEGKAPTARSCHAAAAYKDRYLLVFGGGSVATCFSDLHVLDTSSMTWIQPSITGFAPTPRAGHAGAVVGDAWYLLGGGNNRSGCTEMLALDLAHLVEGSAVWSVLCTIPIKSSLSSEGISLLALSHENALVAFGGYNGKYHNTISIYRVPPSQAQHPVQSKTQAAQRPPTALESNGKGTAAPGPGTPESASQQGLRSAKDFFTSSTGQETVSKPASKPPTAAPSKPDVAAEEPRAAAPPPPDTTSHELSLLRHQLTTTQSQLTETKQALDQAQTLLAKEHAKSLKLEAQVAELQKRVQYVASMESELEALRAQVKESQKKKSGGGIWGYIAGSPPAG